MQVNVLYAVLTAFAFTASAAKVFEGRIAKGTVGLGLTMFDPICAAMCRNSASGWMLHCGDHDSHHGHRLRKRHGSGHAMPSPECYASSDPFLQTLAWCIKTHCDDDVSLSRIEHYWERNIAGNLAKPPTPKYSYQQALKRIQEPPSEVVNSTEVLNRTSLVNEWLYQANYGASYGISQNMTINNIFTLVLLLVTSLTPVLLSLLSLFPWPQPFITRLYAHLIDPPAFGTQHAVPILFDMLIVPTRGQAIYIAYMWILNIVLSSVSYVITWPNLWYQTVPQLVLCSISNRVGMLSFANLSLSILFASRNNVLLWFTNWSRETFVLLHRWLAFICIIQACLHSALYLHHKKSEGSAALEEETALAYWYWGIIGTLAMVIMLPCSLLPFRRKLYELFLAWHVIFAILTLIGCFLHIYFRYHWQWGYEIWVALAFALWGFDRFLARPLRLAQNGLKKAHVSLIDDDYLQISIMGLNIDGQAYLYFPTIGWRLWENHPFSVVPLKSWPNFKATTSSSSADLEAQYKEPYEEGSVTPHRAISNEPGAVFFVRRRGGLTKKLGRTVGCDAKLWVMVESSYASSTSSHACLSSIRSMHQFPNLICIAGGVGITGVLPFLDRSSLTGLSTMKLFWGVRSEALVQAVEQIVNVDITHELGVPIKWGSTEVHLSIKKRFNLRQILAKEVQGERRAAKGTLVMCCGPSEMSDEVRMTVSQLAKQGAIIRFYENKFSY